ncbi:MAG: hypothetical protein IJT75_01325 [Bacteroidaceae bacterium]|nr:hypothetical protein [Bacteroidaceae bacterium]
MKSETKIVRVYSVACTLTDISEKCYKAKDVKGNVANVPKSVVYGKDEQNTDKAYWIAGWFLRKSVLAFSKKYWGVYDKEKKRITNQFRYSSVNGQRKEVMGISVTLNGQPISSNIKRVNSLTADVAPRMKPFNWNPDGKYELSFNVEETEEMKRWREIMEDQFEQQYLDFIKRVDEAVENILRNHVTPPVSGDIAKADLESRGIKAIVFTDDGMSFVGVVQRDWLILPDGERLPWSVYRG